MVKSERICARPNCSEKTYRYNAAYCRYHASEYERERRNRNKDAINASPETLRKALDYLLQSPSLV